MVELSRNAKVLRFLLEAAPGVGRIKLAKYAYLADLEATRHLGRSISGFHYIRDSFGPFDKTGFYRALDELKKTGAATECEMAYPNGYLGFQIDPTPEPVEYDFTLAEAAILDYVAETYLDLSGKSLCEEIVYQTEPMQNVNMGDALPMERVKPPESTPLGFNLERMLSGERSAQAGRHRSLTEAIDELRARYSH